VVIGGEHLFIKAHNQLFPETPWVYQPHSLVVDQEIKSYKLPWVMEKITQWLYSSLQRWALNRAQRTVRFTRQACEALLARYGARISPRFVVNPQGTELPPPPEEIRKGKILRLLWVGQLIPRKRIHVALEALAALPDINWHFDIVGDGVSRGELE